MEKAEVYDLMEFELLVNVKRDGPEPKCETVRRKLKRDLRDKGWDAKVWRNYDDCLVQNRKFCGYSWEDMDRVLTVICEVEDRVDMTDQEMNDYDIAVQCVAQVMNRMRDGKPIEWD